MDPHWRIPQQQNQQLPIINHIPQYHIQNPNINPVSESNGLPHEQLMRSFWESQRVESEQANDFRNHSLPLARIKKIMKSDHNVRMISAETPVLLSRACDMFIQDLTFRSWISTEESKRRTLQKGDISAALSTTDLFDFLVDIVPREKPIATIPSVLPLVGMARNDEHQQQEPIVTMQPVKPLMVMTSNNEQQQQDYTLGEGSGVGLTMGFPMEQVRNVQANGSWSWLTHQAAWPPPDH